MVKTFERKRNIFIKRVRDTSLWKFAQSSRQTVNVEFRLCHDTGSACYSTSFLVIYQMVYEKICVKYNKFCAFYSQIEKDMIKLSMYV